MSISRARRAAASAAARWMTSRTPAGSVPEVASPPSRVAASRVISATNSGLPSVRAWTAAITSSAGRSPPTVAMSRPTSPLAEPAELEDDVRPARAPRAAIDAPSSSSRSASAPRQRADEDDRVASRARARGTAAGGSRGRRRRAGRRGSGRRAPVGGRAPQQPGRRPRRAGSASRRRRARGGSGMPGARARSSGRMPLSTALPSASAAISAGSQVAT